MEIFFSVEIILIRSVFRPFRIFYFFNILSGCEIRTHNLNMVVPTHNLPSYPLRQPYLGISETAQIVGNTFKYSAQTQMRGIEVSNFIRYEKALIEFNFAFLNLG